MRNKIILLTLGLLFIAFWQWWLPGPRVAVDFPIVLDRELSSQIDLPRVWAEKDVEGLGEYSVFTLWSYPATLISAVLAKFGLGFALQERILWIIPFLLFGIFGVWKLCKQLNLSDYAKSIACILYLANTYILLVIDGGQLSIALSYALLPICFLIVKNSINASLKKRILAGLSVFFIGIFDIRVIFILSILVLAYLLYGVVINPYERFKWITGGIKTTVVCILIVVTLNAYWLTVYIQNPISSATFQKLTQTNFQTFSNLGHGMLLIAPHWYKNVFGNVAQLHVIFFLIPLLVFLAPILKPKNKIVGFWIFTALLSIFLVKGANEPLPQAYIWLFTNVPGFSLFRDSTKFFFLVALSFSILFAVSTDEILKRINRRRVFFIFILGYLLILISPIWLGKMTGTFSKPVFEKEYSKLSFLFDSDKDFSRIFWIPTKPPLGFYSSEHPSVEAIRLVERRPFEVGSKGTYEILNFLREAPFMGEIFDVAGIGYIAYPPLNPKRDNLHSDNINYYNIFSNQISRLSWLSKVEGSPIALWKTLNHQDKFFVSPNIWGVVGSDSIYNEAAKSSTLRLSNNALVFVEEHPGLLDRVIEVPEAKIILNRKTLIDLAASFIDSTKLIFPAGQLDVDPNESGWWKRGTTDLISWRDFLQTKYGIDNQDFDLGGGWAVGEGEKQYQISNIKYQKDSVLIARVMESSRSGSLKFYQGDQFIGEVITKTDKEANVRWFEVEELSGNDDGITIESTGDINVVNALAVLDKNEWAAYQDRVKKLQDRIDNYEEKNVSFPTQAVVTYQMINPTKYSVKVENLEEPSFLVFSESYDPNWQIEGNSSLPIYSFLNGFKIERNGIYEVVFKSQEKVEQGLLISMLTLIVSFGLLYLWVN